MEETENNDMERVIDSEIFREELQEMVAERMLNNTLTSNQPLLDILSIRQRFCKADRASKQGISNKNVFLSLQETCICRRSNSSSFHSTKTM